MAQKIQPQQAAKIEDKEEDNFNLTAVQIEDADDETEEFKTENDEQDSQI